MENIGNVYYSCKELIQNVSDRLSCRFSLISNVLAHLIHDAPFEILCDCAIPSFMNFESDAFDFSSLLFAGIKITIFCTLYFPASTSAL